MREVLRAEKGVESMRKIIATPLSVSVHQEGESPVFSETATIVSIDDDAGGPFIVIEQNMDHMEPGKIKIDGDELSIIFNVAKELLAAHEALKK